MQKLNAYKNQFKQGAIIIPRSSHFIESLPDTSDSNAIRGIGLSTFQTALSKNILPFALYKTDQIVLPITIESDNCNKKKIKLNSASDVQKNKNTSSEKYLNWQNKLTEQDLNMPYLVLCNASSKEANATVIKRSELDLEFVVEVKTFWFGSESINEAYYVAAFLNAGTTSKVLKEFQSQNRSGVTDAGKNILDIYYPRFNKENIAHIQLAELSALAHKKAKEYIDTYPSGHEISSVFLSKLRSSIKKYLKEELQLIDHLVVDQLMREIVL